VRKPFGRVISLYNPTRQHELSNVAARFGERELAEFASTTEEVQTEFAGGYHMDETVTMLVIILQIVAIVVIIDAAT
jgi:hypothetical protein